MSKQTTSFKKTLLGGGALLTACLTLLPANNRVAGKYIAQENAPQVINRTAGFQVESLTLTDGDYVLSLRNTYGKSINGYVLSTGPGSKLTVELTTGGFVIAPGSVKEVRVPVTNLKASPGPNAQRQITLLAVLLEDGTGDGDPQEIAGVKGLRDGAKMQLQRVLVLIEDFLASAEADDPAALNKLREQITALSEEPDKGMHLNARTGLRAAKQDALRALQSLEQHNTPLQERLSQLKVSTEKRISRL